MNKAEYLNIALKIPPQKIIGTYDLLSKQCDREIYARIGNGMYVLLQVGIIELDALKEHLYILIIYNKNIIFRFC